MLVLKHAVEHDEFLAAAVRVRRKHAVWFVADDGRCPRDLAADAVQHPSAHSGRGRLQPFDFVGMHRDPLAEVRIQFHFIFILSLLRPSIRCLTIAMLNSHSQDQPMRRGRPSRRFANSRRLPAQATADRRIRSQTIVERALETSWTPCWTTCAAVAMDGGLRPMHRWSRMPKRRRTKGRTGDAARPSIVPT